MRTWPALDISRLTTPDRLQAALVDLGVYAVHERDATQWRVFFHTADERGRARRLLARDFPELSISSIDVPDEQWAERSQASLRAVRVGRLVVAPPWDVPRTDARSIVVTISPSMGFGTGHHATTRLCLAALQRLDVRGRSVVDVGTGSGVLAIAAACLGASRVVGIDDDPDAIQSARENLALNASASVEFKVEDLRHTDVGDFDLVLANLTGGLLVRGAQPLQQLAARSGRLILSGFQPHEEADVLGALRECEPFERSAEEEWACVTLRKR